MGLQSERTFKEFEIPQPVSDHAQQLFIESRKKEHERDGKVKTDDYAFHRYLVLARYMSVAKEAKLTLSDECYDLAR